MPLILGAQSATAATGVVTNSCRFNPADDPTLTLTLGTPTNRDKWTFSAWIKKSDGAAASDNGIMQMGPSTDFTHVVLAPEVEVTNKISSSFVGRLKTNAVYRDITSWYHMVVVWDSDNGTPGDRIRLYVNGAEITSFGTDTNPTSGELSGLASGNDLTIGSAGTYELDGYMAEVVLCDGQAYTPSDFGEFDEDSPTIWKPIDVSGLTFGAQGFYLDFEDSANLGADVSGNGNDFTEANLDATDQATDTPVNNFCTMNPLDNYLQSMTFSQGNNEIVTDYASPATGTIGVTAGKWYWECKAVASSGGDFYTGISSTQVTDLNAENGYRANDWSYYGPTGNYLNNNTDTSYGTSYSVADIIGVALDITNSKLYFSKGGVWQDSGDPTSGASGTGAISITAVASTPLGSYTPAAGGWSSSVDYTWAFNFGGSPAFTVSSGNADGNGYGNFEYEPPSGYLALCTKNLATDGG